MNIEIFNTYSKTYENFIPIDSENVRIYVCGPTVYDFIHVGNARPLIILEGFDELYLIPFCKLK